MGIEQFITSEVKANDVVLFMKGTPQSPMCGFSGQVVQILDYLGVPYKGVNVLDSEELRQAIKAYANWLRSHNSMSRASSWEGATSYARCSRRANSRRC